MLKYFFFLFFLFFSLFSFLYADFIDEGDLMRDLMRVEQINRCVADCFPVYFNQLLYGGYINMPSSRMGKEGEIGGGWSCIPPYRTYNIRFQAADRVEFSGNYRIFKGVKDPILSATGFGDFSDKGVNVKVALWFPEDSNYRIPGLAIGWDDFLGTKSFQGEYIVLTQVFPSLNLEASCGYGKMRYRGWFGGLSWIPFRDSCRSYLKNMAFVLEYDCIPYKSKKREPHPRGRVKKSPINWGCKYRLWDFFDASVSYIRGDKVSFSFSAFYNLGMSNGFLPKVNDPLPYRNPVNIQPLGPIRPSDALAEELAFSFRDQGFELLEMWFSTTCSGQTLLRLELVNFTYPYERDLRNRLNDLLASLIPKNIDQVVVIVDAKGFPVQEYHFQMPFVRLYGDRKICPYELFVLSPLCEVPCYREEYCPSLIFKQRQPLFYYRFAPRSYTAFGSAKGKFKYMVGLSLAVDGYLGSGWYYQGSFGVPFSSNLDDVKDVDKLNPSQLINVRTDVVNYYKKARWAVDQFFIQKNWNLFRGWYGKVAAGLFEVEYGGVAGELLYYPVNSVWAFGIEGAYLRKRTYTGIGFTNKVRQLHHYHPIYHHFYPKQYFLNFYYNFPDLDVDVAFKGGKFLANDWGVKSIVSRYYPSGMRVYGWFTYTNGKDRINGHRYYDKGVGISIPLDMFYTYSSRKRWNYGLSAWLRDVGVTADTGNLLYPMIRDQREVQIR